MNKKEAETRENLKILDAITRKLDLVRNEIKPYYGGDITISEFEELLWNQYLKYSDLVSKAFA